MPSHDNHDRPLVAVIGAGVVGLTTALLFQCNGYGTAKRHYNSANGGVASPLHQLDVLLR